MSAATEGYAHPEMLADTRWLTGHLQEPNVRVVDMGSYDGYVRAHVTGAVHVGLADKANYVKEAADPLHVMSPDGFAQLMGRLGIGDDTTVVAYDADGGNTAARLWWVMDYYGNSHCKILDGGWAKWLTEGCPVSNDVHTYPQAVFTTRVNPERICKLDTMKRSVGSNDVAMVDVRSQEEWEGTETRGNKRSGHIPGAVHLEWRHYVTDDAFRTLRPAHELRALFAKSGVTPEKLAVTY